MSMTSEILEVVREIPGPLTAKQIGEYTPEINFSNLTGLLQRLWTEGKVARERVPNPAFDATKRGGHKQVWAYTINANGQRPAPPVKAKKNKQPIESALEVRVRELQAQLNELETWKAMAVERYPDLKVDPVVLKARRILADVFDADGDPGGAATVLAGKRDSSPALKAVIAALSQ